MTSSPAAALDEIEARLRDELPDVPALLADFDCLQDTRRTTGLAARDLRRMFAVCYAVLGLGPAGVPQHLDAGARRRLEWRALPLVEQTFFDPAAESRQFIRHTLRRSLALNRPEEGGDLVLPPLPHVPLDRDEAEALARPYLGWLERQVATQPYAHARMIWEVRTAPVPPFDRIFDDWLRDIDRRGIGTGDSRDALALADGLVALATQARQRLSWTRCAADILPLLAESNLMVVGAAARFLGVLYGSDDLLQGAAPPMPEILDHIAALGAGRRIAAGGFLQGAALDDGDPFRSLSERPDMVGYDIDGWVLRVLDRREPEPSLPTAISFWFHVHEHYWNAPKFVMRLIDEGHPWEAMMCATEAPDADNGMEPVLRRLAASDDAEVSASARSCLIRVFGAT